MKLSFNEVWGIYEKIQIKDIIDLSAYTHSPFMFDFGERLVFEDLKEMLEWIYCSGKYINNLKLLDSCEYMLDKDYYNQRVKGKNKWFVKQNNDAILVSYFVSKGIKINTNSYEHYKQNIMELLFIK